MYLHTCIFIFTAAAMTAFAQSTASPAKAPAALKVHKIGKVVVTGSFRTRQEGWGWFTPDAGDPNYTFSGNILRLSLSQAKENWSWQTEFAVPILLGLPQNAQGPGAQGALGLGSNYFTANSRQQNSAMFFPKQAFLSFKNQRLVTRVGRFEFNDGSEMTPKNGTLAALKASRIKVATYDLLFWGATQTGKWGNQDHQAYSFDVEGGFQPKAKSLLKLKPWVRAGYSVSSGDDNPADNQHRTFFQVMPTPRPFARFPFFNMMNNKDIYSGVILRPHPKLSISSEFHSLGLQTSKDLWYSGGGVFQPWTFGYAGRNTSGAKSLANLYDSSVDITLNPAVSLNLYYGYAQGLSAIRAIYPKGQSGSFGFVELVYKF